MNRGFILSKLILKGFNLKEATLNFTSGLNVISGPTSTGKSFIFDCLDFMMGGKSLDRVPPEAAKYTTILLEVVASNNYYTLERSIKGGQFNLYKTKYKDINDVKPEILLAKHSKDNENNISSFFLSLCNLTNKEIRTNKKGKKNALSFRDICHLSSVSENEIIKTESPIFAKGGFQKTKELNIVKFLVTGVDDDTIIPDPDEKILHFTKGKIEVIEELISDLKNFNDKQVDISKIESDLLYNNEQIIRAKEKQQELFNSFYKNDKIRKEFSQQLSEYENELKQITEVLTRSNILQEHYSSDIKRLRSTIEAGMLLNDSEESNTNCPICNSKLENKEYDEQISVTIKACESEVLKTLKLIEESNKSVELLVSEKNNLKSKISHLYNELQSVEQTINLEIKASIEKVNRELEEYYSIRESLQESHYYVANLDKLLELKDEINSSAIPSQENVFDELTSQAMYPISQGILRILKACNYSNLKTVSYSEKNNDFIIDGKNRSLFGKGERAITYATFVLSLYEFLFSKDYRLSVPILDSPLVTYKKPEAENEGITEDLAMDFYRYCANQTLCDQIIILENEEPPQDIINKINHTKFTKSENQGRYGFIPKN